MIDTWLQRNQTKSVSRRKPPSSGLEIKVLVMVQHSIKWTSPRFLPIPLETTGLLFTERHNDSFTLSPCPQSRMLQCLGTSL
ncbi:hypothetical protein NPIL_187101 [Nephila pilipes]|uniref:Uncharacterized protein n=1 Tax=Nephila pilipes TaxID=299642 RepID=A0A8X6TYF8_NEPPI|nr:hypothetical protein NPIL_187101 [Nephila pilipes]